MELKDKKLYMIGNTHFDPVWLWTYDEGLASIRATFRSALDRMKEDVNFIYSFSCPPVFEWVKQVDLQLFNEIKERVEEGRWDLCEGLWLQPDCYSASGESYVRQCVYGQMYLLENFGVTSQCAFNVDSFGHSPMLPQILKKSGMENYCIVRPENYHISLPNPLFKWKSKDGSVVNAYRIEKGWPDDLKDCIDYHLSREENSMLIYGVTDHGGAPTKEAIKIINETKEAEFSTVKRFFDENLPMCEVSKELYTNDFGVYANNPTIKKKNRQSEKALLNAEKSLVIANKQNIITRKLWQKVLFNQFHDILGGACIKNAYDDAENLYGSVISDAKEIVTLSLQSETKNIKMLGKNENGDIWNIVVWNLNGRPFNDYIEIEVQWAHEFDWYDKGIELVDESGKIYYCQVIQAKAVIPKFRSRFVCKLDAPSCGYKVYKVVKTEKPVVENKDYDFLKQKKIKEIIDTFKPVCYEDNGDTWCFNQSGYGKKYNLKFVSRKVVENGEVRKIIKDTYKFKDSLIHLFFYYYVNEDYFDVKYVVNWNEKHFVLKLETSINNYNHIASVPYGEIERIENKRDVPVGEWLTFDDKKLLLDGIFAYNATNKKIGLTVLRSPIYGDLRLEDIDLEKDFDHISQGILEGRIRVCSKEYDGECFNNPPITILECNHNGNMPREKSYCFIDNDNITISVIKPAENNEGVIIRLVENVGNSEKANLTFMDKKYSININPFEIKTLLLKDDIKEVNLLEE